MSANMRVMGESVLKVATQSADLSVFEKYLPPCHPRLTFIVRYCLNHTRDIFSKALDFTALPPARSFQPLGRIVLDTVGIEDCKALRIGSLCYRLAGRRFLPHGSSNIWRDYIEFVNWNSTASPLLIDTSREHPGNEFLYRAWVENAGILRERLYIGGLSKVYYEKLTVSASNGTIIDLPFLKELCNPRQVVVETTKHVPSYAKIFSDYVRPVLPLVTALAGAWAINQAFNSHQTEGTTRKTCLLGLAGITALAATSFLM